MQKLIELLNEYEYSLFEDKSLAPQRWDIQDWVVFEKNFCEDLDKPNDLTMDVTHLISHRFWFVKWLVDNDKIDLWEKLFNLTKNDNRKSIICDLDNNDFSWEDTFLMLLAISDTPIEDLISYLK